MGEALMRGKASILGAASGAVAGLVAITPAVGNVGVGGALVIGAVAGFACLWGVNGLKKLLGADDSLDVFGGLQDLRSDHLPARQRRRRAPRTGHHVTWRDGL